MTMLTVQLEDDVLAKAQLLAAMRTESLDQAVSDAIEQAVATISKESVDDSPEARGRRWDTMMNRMGQFDTSGPFTRDELNER